MTAHEIVEGLKNLRFEWEKARISHINGRNEAGTDEVEVESYQKDISRDEVAIASLTAAIAYIEASEKERDALQARIEGMGNRGRIAEKIEEFFGAYGIPLATLNYTADDLVDAINAAITGEGKTCRDSIKSNRY